MGLLSPLRGSFWEETASELERVDFVEAPEPSRDAAPRRSGRSKGKARLAYDAASRGRLAHGWGRPSTGPNTEVSSGAPLSRFGARDLERNNPHGIRILDVLVSDLIGDGVPPRVMLKKRDPETGRMVRDRERSEAVEALFDDWMKVAVVDGDHSGYGLQNLAVRSMIRDGEALIRARLRKPSDGLPVPLQMEGLEADHLYSVDWVLPTGGKVVQGVEFDPINRRAAYHMLRDHPGEGYPYGTTTSTVRVPADRVVHLYEPLRLGQVRGVSWLAPVSAALRDLDDYHLAERTRKKGESAITAFVTVDDPDEEALNPQVTVEDGTTETEEEDDRPYIAHNVYGLPTETASPGTITFLRGSKEVRLNTPTPVAGTEEWERLSLRAIAVGARMTYELLSDDLSKVNWASYRAGLIAYRKLIKTLRTLWIQPLMLDKVWRWFISAAIASGALAPGFYPVEWSWPRFESVNPLEDAKADRERMRNGTISRRRIIAESGEDPSDVTDEIEDDVNDLAARGLPMAGYVAHDSERDQEPAEPSSDEDEEDEDAGPRRVA